MTGGMSFILASATAAEKTYPMGVVAGLGMGTVFVGLICIVVILSIMNVIFSRIPQKKNTKPAADTAVSVTDEKMDDETVAAVSAAIAETLGRDVSGIRITSIKKIN